MADGKKRMSEYMEVQTRFGAVQVNATDNSHIYVSFSSGSANHKPLVVRGLEYSGSCHFYLYSDGAFRIGRSGGHMDGCSESKNEG